MPAVPTARELGAAFEQSFWWPMIVPARTPLEAAREIGVAAMAVAQEPEFRKRSGDGVITVVGSTTEAFEAFFRDELENWARVVKGLGAELTQK